MPNAVQYTATNLTGSLRKGNVALGVTTASIAGPTSTTGWYNGITPQSGKYTIYDVYGSDIPLIYSPQNSDELKRLGTSYGASSGNVTSEGAILSWFGTQDGFLAANFDYENIVTNGLVLNLDAGFVGSYPTTGNNWYDISGNANNGTLTNGPTFNSANSGSIVFDTTDDYVTVPYNSNLNLTNTVSLETWVKYTTTFNTVLIEKSNNNTSYQLQIFNSDQGTPGIAGQLVFMLQPNPNNWVVSGMVTNDNTWHHVVGTYDSSVTTAKIYVDGQLKNTNSSILTGITSNTQPLLIGSRSGIGGFGGSIGGVRIYNRTLSATEVSQNFNSQKGRFGL